MRYQLVPWGTGPSIDRARAMEAAKRVGAKYAMMASPMMNHLDEHNRITGAMWRGTNQPNVMVFTGTVETAKAVRVAYSLDESFVEERATGRRV